MSAANQFLDRLTGDMQSMFSFTGEELAAGRGRGSLAADIALKIARRLPPRTVELIASATRAGRVADYRIIWPGERRATAQQQQAALALIFWLGRRLRVSDDAGWGDARISRRRSAAA